MTEINPGLRRLHVMAAMQHLHVLKKTLKKLRAASDYHSSMTTHLLYSERKRLLDSEPAYQEAAWRILARQTVHRTDEGLQIYDRWTNEYIPDPVEALKKSGEPGFINLDGIPLKAGDVVRVKDAEGSVSNRVVGDNHADKFFKKPRANHLTYEQRKANGRKGAAKKQENQRRSHARETKRFYLYGILPAVGNALERYNPLGKPFISMRSAFRHLTSNLNSFDAFVIYDNNGKRWNYDPGHHTMISAIG